jgi:hypothetical protein
VTLSGFSDYDGPDSSLDGIDKKLIQNVDGETVCNAATWPRRRRENNVWADVGSMICRENDRIN